MKATVQPLKGRIALVTGASSGIGEAVARRLAAESAAVVVNYRSHPKEAKKIVAEIKSAGGQAIAIRADVSKEREIETMFARMVREFGAIDILINNAGIENKSPFLEMPVQDWDQVMAVNLRGVFLCSQLAARRMVKNGGGFAGQHDSFLNVRGEQALLETVKRCWSSLWTARALEYRARQGVEPSTVWMAVVVQQMVDAEASGVLFTANPMTGARDEIVLDASWGLGEAIVGGFVTPDHIVVNKTTDAIKEIRIGDKAVMTTLSDTVTVECEVDENKRRAQVLSASQVTNCSHWAGRLNRCMARPRTLNGDRPTQPFISFRRVRLRRCRPHPCCGPVLSPARNG